jgi:hypothetical protein
LITVKGTILLVAAAALFKLARVDPSRAAAPSIGLLGIVLFLIAPATATYTCALLWLPISLLVNYFLVNGARTPAYFVLGIYALIGFIPYQYAYPFEGHRGLSLLAYPRLFLLLAMFVGCVSFIAYPKPSRPQGAGLGYGLT